MNKKSVIDLNIKKAIARRKEYFKEYDRVVETINNRIADRMAADPNYSPWDATREAVEILGKIEKVNEVIKQYKEPGGNVMNYNFITDQEMDELTKLTDMTESEILDDFRLFCKYAEIPVCSDSWDYYIVEARNQF